MSDPILAEVAPIVGPGGARRDGSGRLRLLPPSVDALAGVLGVAHDRRWRVALEGGGTWCPAPPAADLVVSLRALDEVTVPAGTPPRLVAGAGVTLEQARREALEHGHWLPLDPPGRPDRTLGSVLATGTTGPLRHLTGPVRELVAALVVVRGDGRVERLALADAADRVRAHLGAFGGLGAIAGCELHLAPIPRADATWMAAGDRDRLTATARLLAARRTEAAAVALFSPALATEGEWTLAVRLLGTRDAILSRARQLTDAAELDWHELPPERHVLLWNGTARALASAPVTLRLAVLPEGLDEAIDLVIARLGEGLLEADPARGGLRWSGDADATTLQEVRTELAAREVPLTLERAPAAIARATGHLGGYREGGGLSPARLRDTQDPHGIFAVPLEPEERP